MKNKSINIKELTYDAYIKHNINIIKLKQPVLKNACKHYKLKISGTKPILCNRLHDFFLKTNKIIKMQSLFRKYLSRIYVKHRGPGVINRNICNNITDFITLEPIVEIDFQNFYSYCDKDNFVYGFNIISLITLLKKTNKIINPYNRSTISKNVINSIITLYNATYLLNREFQKVNDFYTKKVKPISHRLLTLNNTQLSTVDNYSPGIYSNIIINAELYDRLNILNELRQRTVPERIDALFTEIDMLGNYTSRSWFTTLSHLQFIRLYRCMYDLWNYRAQISHSIKRIICPFYDPFDGIFPRQVYQDNITTEQIRKGCLIVFENLVYSSPDIEYRQIGALHALTSLTLVNPNVRIALPWLYESIN